MQPRHRRQPTVLFVCVHNAGRSQMAAGYLQHLAGDRIEVLSAGSEPADQINPVAVEAMAEDGIDITAEQPKSSPPRPCRTPTSSSPWAAATPAPTSRASATRTGCSTTRPARASTPSARSATRSSARVEALLADLNGGPGPT